VGKQCRERWHNQLRPDIKKTAWSQREEAALVRAHARCGNRWVELARALPGRAENNVKNHWNATLRCKDYGVRWWWWWWSLFFSSRRKKDPTFALTSDFPKKN